MNLFIIAICSILNITHEKGMWGYVQTFALSNIALPDIKLRVIVGYLANHKQPGTSYNAASYISMIVSLNCNDSIILIIYTSSLI